MHDSTAAVLVSAVESGDPHAVEKLLVEGADPNTTFDDDRPPNQPRRVEGRIGYEGRSRPILHLAVLLRHEPVVRTLLRLGASVDLTDQGELTALALAICSGQVDVARALLEWDASPEGRYGRSSLLSHVAWASNLDDVAAAEIIRLLVKHGADVEGGAAEGERTPLMAAASATHPARVVALLQVGANPNRTTTQGHTALTEAFRTSIEGHLRHGRRRQWAPRAVGRALIEGGADPGAGFNPVMLAAQRGRAKWVRAAIGAGVPVDRSLPDGRTALHLAASGGFVAAVRALLEAGADPNAADRSGRTALSLVLEEGTGSNPWARSLQVESDLTATIQILEQVT